MVDISSQEKKINIKIQSGGVQANVGVTQDTAQYYSEKAREWAISNRIVDGVDYSSKYYAEKSNQSALNAQSFAQSAQDSYNNFQQSVDGTLSDIDSLVQSGIEDINNTKTDIITEIEFVADGEKQEIEELSEETQNKIIDLGIDTRANVDLSNLSSVGEKHFLNKQQITNCITEIPQDIKLELNNGAITLKAGSKVYVPNGFEADGTTPKFDEIIVANDIAPHIPSSPSATVECVMVYDLGRNDFWANNSISNCTSGATAPITGSSYFYNTSTNILTFYSNGVPEERLYSLPLGVVRYNSDKTVASFEAFNGWGYIGEHLWLTNIKALISDGRNEDGTCKNIEISTPKIKVHKFGNIDTKRVVYLRPNGNLEFISGANVFESTTQPNYTQTYTNKWYNPNTNKTYAFNGTNWNEAPAVKLFTYEPYNSDKKTVRILDDRFAFRAIDYSDKSTVSGWCMPSNKNIGLSLGASETSYTMPANGWLIFGKRIGTANVTQYMQLANTSNGMNLVKSQKGDVDTELNLFMPVRKNDIVVVNYNLTGETTTFRFVYTEGEI